MEYYLHKPIESSGDVFRNLAWMFANVLQDAPLDLLMSLHITPILNGRICLLLRVSENLTGL